MNEAIARQANKGDGCKGHFWESRFRCDPLLTDEALLNAMSYVDLNPFRTGITTTPESSDHTSIKERLNPRFNCVLYICRRNTLQIESTKLQPYSIFQSGLQLVEPREEVAKPLFDRRQFRDQPCQLMPFLKQFIYLRFESRLLFFEF